MIQHVSVAPWKPTHLVHVGGRAYHVQFCPEATGNGPAFTFEEWEAYTRAAWERVDGEWLFHGGVCKKPHTVTQIQDTK